MDMREGLKQSCDVYFYEVARKLGIDRLSETARKFSLGEKVLDGFIEERTGIVPNTSWKKKYINLLKIENYLPTMLLVFMILFQNLNTKVCLETRKI